MNWCDIHKTYFEFDEDGWPNCKKEKENNENRKF